MGIYNSSGEDQEKPSVREKMETSLRRRKAIEERQKPVKVFSEIDKTVKKIFDYWQKQENLRTHRITVPESKIVKMGKAAIKATLTGKFWIDHPDCQKGKKYNFQDWKKSIDQANAVAMNFSHSEWERERLKKIPIVDFISTGAFYEEERDRAKNLSAMSPFLFYLVFTSVSPFQTSKYGKLVDDETLIKNVFDFVNLFLSHPKRYTDHNKRQIALFLTHLKRWADFNQYGLVEGFKKPKQLFRHFVELVYDGKDRKDYLPLLWESSFEAFFVYCLNEGILFDEKHGAMFGDNCDLYWFQITENEREQLRKLWAKQEEESNKVIARLEEEAAKEQEYAEAHNPKMSYKELRKQELREKEVKDHGTILFDLRIKAAKQGWGKLFDMEKHTMLTTTRDYKGFIASVRKRLRETARKAEKDKPDGCC